MPPPRYRWPALLAVLLALSALSLAAGAGRVGLAESWAWLLGQRDDAHVVMVIEHLRLPRLIAALAVGGALGCAGVLLQTVTRNPLAEPGLLGVNSGAAFAVALGFTLLGTLSLAGQMAWALAGALVGAALVLLLARAGETESSPLRLILAGIALTATCHGLMAWLLMSRQESLDQFRFWSMGSLARLTPELLWAGMPLLVAGFAGCMLLLRPLSMLTLGDEQARGLGARPDRIRMLAMVCVALLAGAAVALVGPIAFLGLVAPYFARGLGAIAVPSQLASSALFGAALLLAADIAARLIVSPFEAPASAVIALLGAPLVIVMVRRDALLSLTRTGAE
ncbi:FecCD family ABC transporter permease [Chitinolyticbacter albus]|uniref:FecCD family ABC transporter permease n=1 Tax=Chitinolyticbacter albus TaxID=2961951 RepID=UPI00210F0640|nr:iron ABC transporter permease [Chitinolyticbacter albus]